MMMLYGELRRIVSNTYLGVGLRKLRCIYLHRTQRQFLKNILGEGRFVFDIGANVGTKTSLYRSLGATVVCVEPQEAMCLYLSDCFAGDKQVTIEQVALSDISGSAEMLVCDNFTSISALASINLSRSRFRTELEQARKVQVPITTLDALIAKYGMPDFCKIDVEGYELSVVRGLSQPIPLLSLELNREFIDDIEKCLEYLEKLGPIEVNFSQAETNKLIYSKWVTPAELVSWVNEHPDPLLWGDIYVRVKKNQKRK